MIAAWLAHPDPRSACRVLLDAAAPRTTVLAAAFLGAAADGQCTPAWHRLLDALAQPPGDAESQGAPAGDPLTAAVQDVLSFGHTSGADMLAGFLLLGQPEP
jgi:hypothetical protein